MNSWYICIILLFILAIIETILMARWNKFYFLYGIPVLLLIPVSFIVIMLIISYLIGQRKYNLLVDEITERIK